MIEKEITDAEEQQESCSNSLAVKVKLYRYLKISIPQKMFVIFEKVYIDTAKELPLSKPQSLATPDVKKTKESKLGII